MRSKKTSGIAKSKTEVIIIRIKKAALGTRVSHDWQDRWSPGGRRLQMGVPRGVCFQARRGLRHRFQQKGALNASHQFITFHEYNKKNDKEKWKKGGVVRPCVQRVFSGAAFRVLTGGRRGRRVSSAVRMNSFINGDCQPPFFVSGYKYILV